MQGTHARTLEGVECVRNCADLDSVQNPKKVNEKIYFLQKPLDFVNELVYNKDVNENIYKPHHETPK